MHKKKHQQRFLFEQSEANSLMRLANYVSYKISEIEKKIYRDKNYSLEAYIQKRKEVDMQTKKFKETIEEIFHD